MIIIATAFVITMGWWGFGEEARNTVANVGELAISRDEFRRAYENMYRFYKEKGTDEFKEEAFKEFVIGQLVDNRVWLIAAREMGVTVSDAELREMIIQIPDFQKNGAFDPELYQRLLASIHMTPASFEATQYQELLGGKARMIVREAVALTPLEIAEAQAVTMRSQDSDPTSSATSKDRVLQDMLLQKQQRALTSYQESLKAKVPIKIHRELL